MTWDVFGGVLILYSVLVTNCVLLSALSTQGILESLSGNGSEHVCTEVDGQNTYPLRNCTFHWPTVTCDTIIVAEVKIKFAATDISVSLRFILTFLAEESYQDLFNNSSLSVDDMMADNENELPHTLNEKVQKCLSLKEVDIILDKSQELDNKDYPRLSLPVAFIRYLYGIPKMRVEALFNSTQPVATITVDKSCLTRQKSFCVTSVHMSNDIRIMWENDTEINSDIFWTSLRNLVRSRLLGNIRLLHVVHSAKELLDLSIIVPHLNNFGIEDLMLTDAEWTDIQKNHLSNMYELKVLNLTGNKINSIENDVFQSTPNLEHLILSRNNLIDLPDGISTLQKLENLDLSENKQLNMQHNALKLRKIENLRWLNISDIPLTTLKVLNPLIQNESTVPHNQPKSKLLGLNLKNCDLTLSQDDVTIFNNIPSLVDVDLSRNHISMLPFDMFSSLNDLESLNLASTGLIKHFGLAIGERKSLKFLDLSGNKLTSLEYINISGTVDVINLSDNAISEWNNKDVFRISDYLNATWVRHLNLSHNSITFISENMINSLSNLSSVDLGENPFDCNDCKIQQFQQWLRRNKTTEVLNNGKENNLTCGGTSHKKMEIIRVVVNSTLCSPAKEEDGFNFVVVGIPILVVVALAILAVIGVYGYRFEIAYVRHLINIRRQKHIRDNEPIDQYKYDAFVSYSVSDRDWVFKELQVQLEEGPEKYRLCLHERDFALGTIIANNIVDCMKKSRSTLVVLTPQFVKSQWCRWELEVTNHKLFEDDREFLVLVELKRLERKNIPQHLSYLLDTRTYLEWPEGPGPHPNAWRRLKYALGDSLYQRKTKQQPKEDIELIDLFD